MVNLAYDTGMEKIFNGGVDLDSDDIRLLLVQTTSSAGSQTGAATISAFTTLDELSGAGYSRKVLAGKTVTIDAANNRVEFDFTDVSFTGIDAGTAGGAVIFKFITSDADSPPIFFIDGQFTVTAAAPATSSDTTMFVDVLLGPILSGSVLTFFPAGGGPSTGTATLSANASTGDRSISVNALAASLGLADFATATANVPGNFPIVTNGGNLILAVDPEGALHGQRVT